MKNSIPIDLVKRNQWVLWRTIERNGKMAKIPYSVYGTEADTTNPETWASFNEIYSAYTNNGNTYNGIGFVFTEGDPYVGIDFDDCIDEHGNIQEYIKSWIDKFASYTEFSQSSRGVHIIISAKKPGDKCRKDNVEIYEKNRYFALTGKVTNNYKDIKESQDALNELYSFVFKEDKKKERVKNKKDKSVKPVTVLPNDEHKSDEEIIHLCQSARNGHKFMALFKRGDISGYKSDSEADLALCAIIAFYTQDEQQIDRIFRRSNLYRDKWEREDYSDATIKKAIDGLNTVYKQGVNTRNIVEYVYKQNNKEQETLPVLHTDTWNAEQFVNNYGENIRYDTTSGRWYIWSGTIWQPDNTGYIQQLAKETTKGLYPLVSQLHDEKARIAFVNHIKSSENLNKRNAMITLAQNEPGIPIIYNQWDQNRWLLNFNNGTFDLYNGILQQHRREDYITKQIDANYNPSAQCPNWDKFLNDTFAKNQSMIRFVQKAIGYSLTGSTQEQCIFILHGTGANGKSTFLTTMKELLGEYAQQSPSETLMAKKNGSNATNDLARLKGARFVSSVETEEGRAFAEVLVKQLSGDDIITARFLHKEFFEFRPECKIWLASNHKPRIRGTDYAIWRRIRLIPFTVTVPEEKRDRFLLDKLREEKEGIIAWAIAGCCMWLQEGLKLTEEIHNATEAYKEEMDILSDFLKECCVISNEKTALASDLYTAYTEWCKRSGEREMSQRSFGMKLAEKGFEKHKGTAGEYRLKFFYKGIGMIDTSEK